VNAHKFTGEIQPSQGVVLAERIKMVMVELVQ